MVAFGGGKPVANADGPPEACEHSDGQSLAALIPDEDGSTTGEW